MLLCLWRLQQESEADFEIYSKVLNSWVAVVARAAEAHPLRNFCVLLGSYSTFFVFSWSFPSLKKSGANHFQKLCSFRAIVWKLPPPPNTTIFTLPNEVCHFSYVPTQKLEWFVNHFLHNFPLFDVRARIANCLRWISIWIIICYNSLSINILMIYREMVCVFRVV